MVPPVTAIDKRSLTERDICTKFITPAVEQAGWDLMTQVREQVYFTKGRVIWRGKRSQRGEASSRTTSCTSSRTCRSR